ncbi:MAG: hypothetical protein HKN54_03710 [Flavobacteriaceae bacterium]|nr:hypothetical protein [Flavobacteriaceae bacterium]
MEPIKFEKFIKDKLEERAIQPSAEAWDTLEGRLNENNKTSRKGYWWLAIAASFIGILFMITLMTNSNQEVNHTPVIVDTDSTEEKEQPTTEIVTKTNAVDNKATENTETLAPDTDTVENKQVKPQTKVKQDIIIPKKIEAAVAQKRSSAEISKTMDTSAIKAVVSFEDQKVKDVVEQIKVLQENNNAVTAEEINALLLAAQKEIAMKKIYDGSSNSVNADALLQDVENDLDESFRSRVFKALRSGYENVKTAVADRNN